MFVQVQYLVLPKLSDLQAVSPATLEKMLGGGQLQPLPTQSAPTGQDLRRVLVALRIPLGPGVIKLNPDTDSELVASPTMAAMLSGAVELRKREESGGSTGLSKWEEDTFILSKADCFLP